MKLPRLRAIQLSPPTAPPRTTGAIGLATVAYSPRWNHYSWSAGGHVSQQNEVALINEMIRNAVGPSGPLVRNYAASNQCSVYVRTGLHTSQADPVEHVQVQLGISTAPWTSNACPGYTCHIQYVAGNNGAPPTYPATCVRGLHGGGN